MRAYVYDTETKEDQRAPHDTGLEKSEADLAEFGVLYWKVKGDGLDRTEEIARKRGYNHRQTIELSPDAFGSVYEHKLQEFFTEQVMEGEEARYILDGSGYFDVRDHDDTWIRIALSQGDLLILPSGIHYRSTTDEKDFVKAMRLNTI
ncbi:hypothetical protein G6F57_006021 [Rhizopus arrhizus]|nr:hypothetical protein G6F23_012067 [Rhizopus arrhizus]KAG1395013.1 hypothetical protein G6F58_012023 [Rhizopus delemar]KAG0753314.1 hypothetical protein G6F24_013063 [Rhizopus arrhizus]KAG0773490.1 hypothetical protein G6F22_014831 [Rhizopus arrhizus]KAG0781401.1 hypothetical protein G6F21_011668 [Rhizopus arrhizus]